MSLPRKDIRLKVDADVHQALTVLCDFDGLDIAAFIEREIVRIVHERVHAATIIAQRTSGLGISAHDRDSQGIPGRVR